MPDGPSQVLPDAMIGGDAQACTPGFVDVCGQPAPSTVLNISNPTPLNTDTDTALCKKVTQNGRDLCLIYVTAATITATGSLTVTGTRPLALVSATMMQIDGQIDVGSHGPQVGPAADDASCAFATNPDTDLGGGGGGAGGTFTLNGGNGGNGDKDNSLGQDGVGTGGTRGSAVSATTLMTLRGGCRGQRGGDESQQPQAGNGGNGGHSGGALYLGALQSLSVAGKIRATGAGGAGGQAQSGGGGGGAGGLVVIESPSITISGQISANGGGGGQGGGRVKIGPNTIDVTGIAGDDGDVNAMPAAGGFGANNNDNQFSRGGAGGAGTMAAVNGGESVVGGGGGGGAAGAIRLLGTSTPTLGGSTISPPPS